MANLEKKLFYNLLIFSKMQNTKYFLKELFDKGQVLVNLETVLNYPSFSNLIRIEEVNKNDNTSVIKSFREFDKKKFEDFLEENNLVYMLGIYNPEIGANNIKIFKKIN